MSYVFDVDGTLTPSRKQIDPEFLLFMMFFAARNNVYLVTGSDRDKTIEQIGIDLYNSAKRVYNCSGSDVYEGDENVYRDDWKLPQEVERFLEDELAYSCFPIRNGLHIEHRPGTVNFSILGRGKDPTVGREEYIKWDKERMEREDIADRVRNQFPDLYVALGGQTGLDIAPMGGGKEQIIRDFEGGVKFYGDRMDKGGNDYSLAMAIRDKKLGETFHVYDYKHTWELLEYETT
tara:strand:- start:80 stop:781 length:702 start_codon:yes stop_codon:yes gene_type:complete